MGDLTVVLPAYKEAFLNNTIKSLVDNTEAEIIPVIDGYEPDEPLIEHPRVKPIINKKNLGMRGAINVGFKNASTPFVMKMDAHCAVDKDFDKKMVEVAEEDKLYIPRRWSLKDDTWEPDFRKRRHDYHFLTFPQKTRYGYWYSGPRTYARKEREKIMIDETPMFQGSCYMAYRPYFMEHIYPLDNSPDTYGSFYHDPEEVGMKYWLNGGGCWVNKNTWYAHLSKRNRHYRLGLFTRKYKRLKGRNPHHYCMKHWMDDEEPGMERDFEWFLNKFLPLPRWKDNWREGWEEIKKKL